MLGKVNNVSFTAKIIKNHYFNEGLNNAKKDAETSRGQERTNEFINAVKYIENINDNDHYSIESRGAGRGNCVLLKNGIPVQSVHTNSDGYSVTKLFTEYVKNNFRVDLSKPSVPSMVYKESTKNALARLDKVQAEIDKSRQEIIQLDREVLQPKIREDLNSALNELRIYI